MEITYEEIEKLQGTYVLVPHLIPILRGWKCDVRDDGFVEKIPTKEEWDKIHK